MNNTMKNMKALLEAIENNQLFNKIIALGNKHKIEKITAVVITLDENGKVKNHEIGGESPIANFATMAAHKVEEGKGTVVVYGSEDINSEDKTAFIKVAQTSASVTKTTLDSIIK